MNNQSARYYQVVVEPASWPNAAGRRFYFGPLLCMDVKGRISNLSALTLRRSRFSGSPKSACIGLTRQPKRAGMFLCYLFSEVIVSNPAGRWVVYFRLGGIYRLAGLALLTATI